MSLTPTNNVTPPPSPRENGRLNATPTGRSPTTQATVTVIETPTNNAAQFLGEIQQGDPIAGAFAHALRDAHQDQPAQPPTQGALPPLIDLAQASNNFVLNTATRGARRRLFVDNTAPTPAPAPSRKPDGPDLRRIAKNLADRVRSRLHEYSPAPELRVINRLNAALPEATIEAKGPSVLDLHKGLQRTWENMKEEIVPDDIVLHNAMIGVIRDKIPEDNRLLFAIVRAVDATPDIDDQTKARYVEQALALSNSFPLSAEELVARVIPRTD
jgi:hypothetical protein